MMRKLITFILALTILVTVSVMPAMGYGFSEHADYGENKWIDNNQMSVIGMTGIADGWDEVADMGARCDETVTRWYMAHYVCNIMNLSAEATNEFEILFYDLTSEHKYYGEIKAVVNAGYMQGEPDGKFRADEPITTMEAARVLLNVLGYKPYIAVKGFQSALNQTDILDGIPVADNLNQAQILRMIYNAYMSPAIRVESVKKGVNDDSVEFNVDKEYLGLEHLFGIIYDKGILDGTSEGTLTNGNGTIKAGMVTVDGVLYGYSDEFLWETPEEMLGYNIDFYYSKGNDGTNAILYMHSNDKNKTLTVDSKNIASYSNGVYKYYDKNDKVKSAEFSNTAKILFNEVANIAYRDEEMIPKFGSVTLIDNDGKSGYDIVKVESYDFYYASRINVDGQKIYDEESGKVLDVKNADDLTVLSEGKQINFDRIKKGTLLAVKRSSSNSDYDKVVIEVFKPAAKNVKITSVGKSNLSTGDISYSKWDYLDVEQNLIYTLFTYKDVVVMAIREKGGSEYGYLVSAAADGVFEKKLSFLIVDMDGNSITFEGAKVVRIDGIVQSPENLCTVLSDTANLSNSESYDFPLAQPVRFEINESGKLTKIDTLKKAEDEDDLSFSSPEDDSNALRYYDYNTSLYDSNDSSKNIAGIDSTTKVLFVPEDRSDEDAYWNKGFINLLTYSADVCDRDEAGVAGAIFAYYNPEKEGVFGERRFLIISDLRTELNGECGDIDYIVEGYLQSTFRSYKVNKEQFEQLEIGDVIRVETDRDNKIISFQMTFDINGDYSNRESRYLGVSGAQYPLGVGFKMIYGTPVVISGSFIKVTQSMPDDSQGWDPEFNSESYQIRNCSFWKYSEVKGNPVVEPASASDIVTYSSDSENPSKIVVNVGQRADQIYIINK